MAHFAKLDDASNVVQVLVVNNDTLGGLPFPESEPVGIKFLQSIFGEETVWKQTSYNGNFRKNFASFNGIYDSERDAFIPPKLFPSWILNTNTCKWMPPVPRPQDGKNYYWDEGAVSWVEVPAS